MIGAAQAAAREITVNMEPALIFNGVFETRKSTRIERKNAKSRAIETHGSRVYLIRIYHKWRLRKSNGSLIRRGGAVCDASRAAGASRLDPAIGVAKPALRGFRNRRGSPPQSLPPAGRWSHDSPERLRSHERPGNIRACLPRRTSPSLFSSPDLFRCFMISFPLCK